MLFVIDIDIQANSCIIYCIYWIHESNFNWFITANFKIELNSHYASRITVPYTFVIRRGFLFIEIWNHQVVKNLYNFIKKKNQFSPSHVNSITHARKIHAKCQINKSRRRWRLSIHLWVFHCCCLYRVMRYLIHTCVRKKKYLKTS